MMSIEKPNRILVAQSVRPNGDGQRTWSVFWVTGTETIVEEFDCAQRAFDAVLERSPTCGCTAPAPTRAMLSTAAIVAWMDVAERLLKDALEKKGLG